MNNLEAQAPTLVTYLCNCLSPLYRLVLKANITQVSGSDERSVKRNVLHGTTFRKYIQGIEMVPNRNKEIPFHIQKRIIYLTAIMRYMHRYALLYISL